MRSRSALIGAVVAASSCGLTSIALADNYDGTYIGKSTMQSQGYSASGSPVSCKPEYDIKVTVRGNSLTGENLSIGGKAAGTVQPDGSFTAKGGLAIQTQATIVGKIEGNVLRGTYTQMSRNASCTGTLAATRQQASGP